MWCAPESKLVHWTVDFACWSVPSSACVPSKLIIASGDKVSLGLLDFVLAGRAFAVWPLARFALAGSCKLIAGSLGRNELSIACGAEVNAIVRSEQRAVRELHLS
jgi:hypothetical protein